MWSTRSAWAIYYRVLLKASIISTGRFVINPIVSSSVIFIPEGRIMLDY